MQGPLKLSQSHSLFRNTEPHKQLADLVSIFSRSGGDHAAGTFFNAHCLHTSANLNSLVPGRHLVVVWNASHLSPDEKRQTKALNGFLRAGGKTVVLATPTWDWLEFYDVKIKHDPRFSRVFPCKDLTFAPAGQ